MEQAMAYQTIIVETKGRVGIVRLNRPSALNALNAQPMRSSASKPSSAAEKRMIASAASS